MSTIHEALKKVQQERETSSEVYVRMGTTGAPKPKKYMGTALIALGAAIALALVATAGYMLFRPGKTPGTAMPIAQSPPAPAETLSGSPAPADQTASGKSLPTFLRNATPYVPGEGGKAPAPIRPSGATMAAALERGRKQEVQARQPSPATAGEPSIALATLPEETLAGQQTRAAAPADTQRARELFERGLALQEAGDMETASQHYAQSLEADPDFVPSLNNAAVIALTKGRTDLAERALKHAVSLGSGSADPYYNLACLYARQADFEKALDFLSQAIAKDPEAVVWAQQDSDLEPLYENERFWEMTGR
jgi:tetratricopeptide (TPR) repeat protein